MNLDDLTIGDLKRTKTLLADGAADAPHPFIGKFVLCRCSAAGVHTGTLIAVNGDSVILRDSRRLWKWVAPIGVALSGVAQYGVSEGSKLDVNNPEIALTGVIEIILCSPLAQERINGYK